MNKHNFLGRKVSKKILLFGVGVSGKTTILQWLLKELIDIRHAAPATMNYKRYTQIINDTDIVFFDLGGAPAYLDNFTGILTEFLFTGVVTLVFVVDSREMKDISKVKYYLDRCIEKIDQYSPKATVIIFQHKTDLIPQKLREEVYQTTKDYLLTEVKKKILYYETSIFNNSIVVAMCAFYQATLGYIPNDVIPETLTKKT